MNYDNMGIKRSVPIRQNDLRDFKSFNRNKIIKNIQKTKMPLFPLYFWAKSFVKLKSIVQSLGGVFRLSRIIIGIRYFIKLTFFMLF